MPTKEPSLRGRPRDPNKRNAIIDAGRELFVAGGNRRVTVGKVLARAGVSRGTFYSNFADTDALLEAVVRRESDRIVEGALPNNPGQSILRMVLLRFGTSLLSFLSDPEMQAFERRLTAEVDTRPELARRFFEAGPARARDCLVAVVEAAISRGELVAGNATDFVSDLIGLWQGFRRLELVFRIIPSPSRAEIEGSAARGVDLFLQLYGRKPRA